MLLHWRECGRGPVNLGSISRSLMATPGPLALFPFLKRSYCFWGSAQRGLLPAAGQRNTLMGLFPWRRRWPLPLQIPTRWFWGDHEIFGRSSVGHFVRVSVLRPVRLLSLKVTPSNALSAPCFLFLNFFSTLVSWLSEFYLVVDKTVSIFAGPRPHCYFLIWIAHFMQLWLE